MPTMNAANAPHAVAIKMSDDGCRMTDVGRRATPGLACPPSCFVCCPISVTFCRPSSVICHPSSAQHAGTKLDDGDHVEEKHKRPECKGDGDRPGAPAALLLVREYDARLVVVMVHNQHLAPHSRTRPGAPSRSSIKSTANNTNRYRIETPNNRLAARRPSSSSPRAMTCKDSPIIAAPATIAVTP